MPFPRARPRRLRRTPALRALVRETTLRPDQLVLPLFVEDGLDEPLPIDAMPGVSRLSPDGALAVARDAAALGLGGVMLFGIPATKDPAGSGAWDDRAVVQRTTRAIRDAVPGLTVGTDLCLCEYTDHGHCGLLDEHGAVQNDATLELLERTAVSQADAGAEVLYPSDMMDGRIGRIRDALDAAGHDQVVIVAHSAKLASAYYGPFREAAGSTPAFGDRRSYQMDPANGDEAVREALTDVEEGADVLMVKPAGPALDLIRRVKDATRMPVAAYQVSGEYSMIKAGAAAGYVDEDAIVAESLTAIRRAGADVIATYFALDVARALQA
ncbi:Porphobilinogen synthase [Patulibacter medicamentivorans]|uniref:Delta-aminolevulinic acid dehydratase n=1 Tax=Patulibacter medicamentivorans TaxID=1097667 RepID=H0E9L2_9ACTN|nr:porphobilinogen synthase [Patulibacter medicamentivorans]EHN09654.1 Porphobilinogen synthase [Patulibacter medicamentivorans]